jgi:prefoldin subunit 5
MEIKDRVGSIADQVRVHRLESKYEGADREVLRLRAENDALRESMDTTRPRKHRIRRLTTLAVAAGGAYVLGAKAGRERYEQLRQKWSSMRGATTDGFETASSAVSKAADTATGAVAKAADSAEHGAQKVQQMASTAERKADQVEHSARNASTTS